MIIFIILTRFGQIHTRTTRDSEVIRTNDIKKRKYKLDTKKMQMMQVMQVMQMMK